MSFVKHAPAGLAVAKAVTRCAFTTLGLVRVFAVPFASNAASARVLEKAGFVHEGRLSIRPGAAAHA